MVHTEVQVILGRTRRTAARLFQSLHTNNVTTRRRYFVRSTRKLKFGLHSIDLPQDLRSSLERNTGVLIDIVFEDTPAFSANILPGDVLVEIDGIAILNAKHASEVMRSASPPNGECVLKLIRKGQGRTVVLKLSGS